MPRHDQPPSGTEGARLSDPREEPQRGETGMDAPRADGDPADGDAGGPTGAPASARAAEQQKRDLTSGAENAS